MCSTFQAGPASTRARVLAVTVFIAALFAPDVLSATSCPVTPAAQELEATQPLNIGELKVQALHYRCLGTYDADVARVLAEAKTFVEQRAGQVSRPVLVLDIDETSLSNCRWFL